VPAVLAVQLRLIWLDDMAVAPRLLGAVGAAVQDPPLVVSISIPLIRALSTSVVNKITN